MISKIGIEELIFVFTDNLKLSISFLVKIEIISFQFSSLS
jgi:hypothetical protein